MSKYWKGIGLPWGTSIPSVFDAKDDFEVISSSIIWICLTSFGERVMEPTFGSALPSLVFEPNDIQAVAQMKNAVRDAITKWDDRVEFVDFTVEPSGNELRCKVIYRFATDEIHNDILVSEFTLTQDMMAQR